MTGTGCQYVVRRNISVNLGRGSVVCNKVAPAGVVGERYWVHGAQQTVPMCDKHAQVWAKKLARYDRAAAKVVR